MNNDKTEKAGLLDEVEKLEQCMEDERLEDSAKQSMASEKQLALHYRIADTLDSHTKAILALKERVDKLSGTSSSTGVARPLGEIRELEKSERTAIKKLLIMNLVTTVNRPRPGK